MIDDSDDDQNDDDDDDDYMYCGTTASCDDWLAGDLINLYKSVDVNNKGTWEYIYIWDLRESHNNWVALKNECERWICEIARNKPRRVSNR